MKRPTISDPTEYALIKKIHFKDSRPLNEEIDPIERNERFDSKLRNKNKSSR
jgi:hypothetical protein